MRELGANLDLAKEFGADEIILKQLIHQLIYYVVSISLNQLLGMWLLSLKNTKNR